MHELLREFESRVICWPIWHSFLMLFACRLHAHQLLACKLPLAGDAQLWPAWITAAGATAAVTIAFTVFRSDLRQRREAEKRSQARLFDLWVSNTQWRVDQPPDAGPTEYLFVEFNISNASGQAIRGVDVHVTHGSGSHLSLVNFGVVPPTAPGAPKDGSTWIAPSDGFTPESAPSTFAKGLLHLDVEFTDASGNRWSRSNRGRLTLLYNLTEQAEGSNWWTRRLSSWRSGRASRG